MIETVTAYKVGNETFPTLEQAQVAKITALVVDYMPGMDAGISAQASQMIVDHFSEFAAVLGNAIPKPKTRKPRKDKGQKRQKAPAEQVCGVTVEGSGKYEGQ